MNLIVRGGFSAAEIVDAANEFNKYLRERVHGRRPK